MFSTALSIAPGFELFLNVKMTNINNILTINSLKSWLPFVMNSFVLV